MESQKLSSQNGPPFSSTEMANFAESWQIEGSYEKPDSVSENVSASSSIVHDETQVDTSQPVDDGGFIENDSIRPLDDEGDFTEQDDNAGVSEPSEESQPDNEGIET
ncbi:hypothetical protein U1Q18_047539 [Sarracenia purpurea var. burkii]